MSLATSLRRPKRIMLTTDTVGGVWHYTLELTRAMSAAGLDVALLTLGPTPRTAQLDEAYRSGARIVDITDMPLDWTAGAERDLDETSRALRQQAQLWHADLVHLNAPAYVGLEPWPCAVVATIHSCVGTWWTAVEQGEMPHTLAWRAARTALGMKAADAVIAPSRSFVSALTALYGPAVAATVIHNGRGSSSLAPAIPGETVLTAGRLWDRGKNIVLLDAAAEIAGLTIFAAGADTGPNGEHVTLPHLKILGSLDETHMAAWHARAGIFVSPSLYEPFGLAVLEAARAHTALILSDIPTFRELWDGAAMFIDGADAQGFADAIRRLQETRSERLRLATAAAHRAAEYTPSEMGRRTLAVYQRVLASRHGLQLAGGLSA